MLPVLNKPYGLWKEPNWIASRDDSQIAHAISPTDPMGSLQKVEWEALIALQFVPNMSTRLPRT